MAPEQLAQYIDGLVAAGCSGRTWDASDDVYRWTCEGRQVQLHCLNEQHAVVVLLDRAGEDPCGWRVHDVQRVDTHRIDNTTFAGAMEFLIRGAA